MWYVNHRIEGTNDQNRDKLNVDWRNKDTNLYIMRDKTIHVKRIMKS